jgi:hypothetical protein
MSSILGGSLGFLWDKVERMLIFWSEKTLSAKEEKELTKLVWKILVVGDYGIHLGGTGSLMRVSS